MSALSAAMVRPPRPAFLAFEGGGAMGLVHLGALHAIEDTGRFDIKAHAGTSAGAMVAALAAAGYTANELFALADRRSDGPTAFHTLLDLLGMPDATSLLGDRAWRRLRHFRLLMGPAGRRVLALFGALTVLVVALIALGWLLRADAGSGPLAQWLVPALPGLALTLAGLGLAALALIAVLVVGGAPLDPVRDACDTALRLKIPNPANGHRITFRDIPNLKICAANLTRRRLELFSAQTHPDVAVADAIAASICFPFVFRPQRLSLSRRGGVAEEWFCDGGLLSNLPAWPFDEERRLHGDALTLAIAIGGETSSRPPGPWSWVWAMVRTAVFGGAILSTRGAGPIEVLRLDTGIGLFSFDLTKVAAEREVRQAREASRILLANRVLGFPDVLRRSTEEIRAAAELWAGTTARALGTSVPSDAMRVALAVPEDHVAGGLMTRERNAAVRSLTLRYGAGYAGFADEGMVLPIAGNTVGTSWRGAATVGLLAEAEAAFRGEDGAWRGRRVRRGLAWVLAVPLTLRWPSLPGETETLTVDAVLVVDSIVSWPPEAEPAWVDAIKALLSKEILPRLQGLDPEIADGQDTAANGNNPDRGHEPGR